MSKSPKRRRSVGGGSRPAARDGDRRRRTLDLPRLALERKAAERDWNIDQAGPQHLPDTDPAKP